MKFPVRSSVLVQLFLQTARSQRAFDGAVVELQPVQVVVPAIVIPQALAGPWQTTPSAISAGATAGQPVQPPIPEVVDPQLFAGEVQATPYPAGFAGALTLQIPEQGYVPTLEAPQAFVMVQLTPRYQGSAIAGALQPAQPMVPALEFPQEFAGPEQPPPYPAGRAGAATLQAPGVPAGLT